MATVGTVVVVLLSAVALVFQVVFLGRFYLFIYLFAVVKLQCLQRFLDKLSDLGDKQNVVIDIRNVLT